MLACFQIFFWVAHRVKDNLAYLDRISMPSADVDEFLDLLTYSYPRVGHA